MNDIDYITRCRPQPSGTADIDAELQAAGLISPEKPAPDCWTDSSNSRPPEREEREVIPEGQSPFEIADRERQPQPGPTMTQEEATGWA